MKLSTNREFFKMLDISDNEYRPREIWESLDNCKEISQRDIRGYKNFLNKIEEIYGSFAVMSYFYYTLRDYMYEPKGAYEHCFNREQLTDDICQRVEDGEYYDLDILKLYGERLAEFVRSNRLKEHFNNVKIQTDNREFITKRDIEHEALLDILLNKLEDLDLTTEDDEFEVECDDSNFEGIIFTNPKAHEIFNVDEVKEFSQDLLELFSELNVEEKLEEEFERLYNLNEKNKEVITIKLEVCGDPQKGKPLNSNEKFFSDMIGHPQYILREFEECFDRCVKDPDCDTLIVDTYSEHIVNQVRWLIYKKLAVLQNDRFIYVDMNGVEYTLTIRENGKYFPEFPEGFFDATIQKIFEINGEK